MRLALAVGLPLKTDPERSFSARGRGQTKKADRVSLPAGRNLLSGGECAK